MLSCYKTLKKDYKNHFSVELDVIHISQLLNDLINNDNIDFKIINDLNISVTYNDHCYLDRHFDEFEAPRKIIKNSLSLLRWKIFVKI